MAWKELRFPLNGLDADQVTHAIEALGALAVTLEDAADEPLLEPAPGAHPMWKSGRVRALFHSQTDIPAITAALRQQYDIEPGSPMEVVTVADQQWEMAWRRELQPLRFGRRLWVCPSSCAPPDPGAVNLIVDPGLAFGTGTHPTTALCLEWLDQANLHGTRVIDYGCGSGILAIAAARLGACHVRAVDHDMQALSATRVNAERNNVAERIEAVRPEALAMDSVAVVLANILARPLVALTALFARLVAPSGELVLSGILESQQDELIAAYARWFTLRPWAVREGWLCLAGRRHETV